MPPTSSCGPSAESPPLRFYNALEHLEYLISFESVEKLRAIGKSDPKPMRSYPTLQLAVARNPARPKEEVIAEFREDHMTFKDRERAWQGRHVDILPMIHDLAKEIQFLTRPPKWSPEETEDEERRKVVREELCAVMGAVYGREPAAAPALPKLEAAFAALKKPSE